MPNPPEGVAEAQGEWVELYVEEGGELAGIVLTDADGEGDFTFPSALAAAGHRLLVANGESLPEGVDPQTAVFFARKTWWTFDNEGDDLSVLSASGGLLDQFAYGSGGAVDARASAFQSVAVPPAPPQGATVGRIGGSGQVLAPTPGGPNRGLDTAGNSHMSIAGVVTADKVLAVVLCNDGPSTVNPFLWAIEGDASRIPLSDVEIPAGGCTLAGRSLSAPLLASIAGSIGRGALTMVSAPDSVAPSFGQLRVLDPLGSTALTADLAAIPQGTARSPVLWINCTCDGGWLRLPLAPVPAIGPERTIANLALAAAGPELDALLLGFIGEAVSSLEVNTYLLTSQSVVDALVHSAERGAAVRVLLEPSPAGVPFNETALTPANLVRMALAGAEVRLFNTSGAQPSRDHAKYLVADAQEVLVLTENMVEAALRAQDPNTGYALRLHSPGLALDLLSLFEWDYLAARELAGPLDAREAAPIPVRPSTPNAVGRLLVAPGDSPLQAWVDTVDAANRSVDLEMLSVDLSTAGPGAPLGAALVRAAARGVAVRVLVASSYSDATAADGNVAVAKALVGATAGWGSPVLAFLDAREREVSSKLHAKILVADNGTFILGSHNLVASAFTANREVSLLIRDASAGKALAERLALDFARAKPVFSTPLDVADGLTLGSLASPSDRFGDGVPLFAELLLAGGALVGLAQFAGLWRRRRRRPRKALRRGGGFPKRAHPQDSANSSVGTAPPPLSLAKPADADAFSLRASVMPAALPESLRLPPTALELLEDR